MYEAHLAQGVPETLFVCEEETNILLYYNSISPLLWDYLAISIDDRAAFPHVSFARSPRP